MRTSAFVKKHFWGLLFCLCIFPVGIYAQVADSLGLRDYHLLPEDAKKLEVEIDNICFFKNNEFAGQVLDGYTLPGFWVQLKGSYQPLKNLKLELGAHALVYSGAYQYPNYAFHDIAIWKGHQYQRGARVLPYLRAQLSMKSVNLVFGDLYGGVNHGLIAPLYNPELQLTADPEAGFQILHDSPYLHLDIWINWMSFVFKEDNHQESFLVGLSSEIRYNPKAPKVQFYSPIQLLAQHFGGENLAPGTRKEVNTLWNAAVGIGMDWKVGRKALKRVNLEADALAYYRQAGKRWPFAGGAGVYGKVSFDFKYGFHLEGAAFYGEKMVSILGHPYYGAVSIQSHGMTFKKPKLYTASLDYTHTFGKHYALGAKLDAFYYSPKEVLDADHLNVPVSRNLNFTVGVFLKVNPSFLIKQF